MLSMLFHSQQHAQLEDAAPVSLPPSAARPLLAQAWGPPSPSLAAMAPRDHVQLLQASKGSCTVGLLIPWVFTGGSKPVS